MNFNPYTYEVYAVNPAWVVTKDNDRVILYKLDVEDYQLRILSPKTALFLTFFDGKRTFSEVSDLHGMVFDFKDKTLSLSECTRLFQSVNSFGDVIIPLNNALGPINTYSPRDYIVNYNPPRRTRLSKPLRCSISPTNKCQTNCIYCFAERARTSELSLKEWFRIFEQMNDLGIRLVELAGGDPLAREDSIDICCRLIELDMLFFISTKCFVSIETAERLSRAGFSFHSSGVRRPFQISCDAADPIVADKMTGSKGYLNRVCKSISNLNQVGIPVRIRAVLTPLNYREVKSIVHHFSKMGVSEFHISCYSRSIHRHDDRFLLTDKQKREVVERCAELKLELPNIILDAVRMPIQGGMTMAERKAKWTEIDPGSCVAGRHHLAIAADGRVTLCEEVPLKKPFVVGDVRRQSIMEVWTSNEVNAFLAPERSLFKGTICMNCEEFEVCQNEGKACFRDTFKLFGSIYKPTPNCYRITPTLRLV